MFCRVLVVDDSKLARMAILKALKALRPYWSVVEAANSDDALSAFKTSGADIALLDYNMPGRNGGDLLIELRALRPAMPIALVTANFQAEVIARANELGATHILKPLNQARFCPFSKRPRPRFCGAAN
jgi:CheY-like chemotaxis protein